MENNAPQNDITKTFSELVEILAAKLTDKISEQTASEAMAKLEDRLPSLEEACDLDSRIESLKSKVEDIDVDDHEDRIDQCESDISDLKDQIDDQPTDDSVREIAQEVVADELNCQLGDMIKQYLTENLQITFSFKN
jgi:chromosome segregation ATPase